MFSLKSRLVNWFHRSKITQSMPPKARVRKPKPKSALKKRGRPLDAHQTNMKVAWRLWSSRRYEKNRAAWNAYTVKNRAEHKQALNLPESKRRASKLETAHVRHVIKFCSKNIRNFPKISL